MAFHSKSSDKQANLRTLSTTPKPTPAMTQLTGSAGGLALAGRTPPYNDTHTDLTGGLALARCTRHAGSFLRRLDNALELRLGLGPFSPVEELWVQRQEGVRLVLALLLHVAHRLLRAELRARPRASRHGRLVALVALAALVCLVGLVGAVGLVRLGRLAAAAGDHGLEVLLLLAAAGVVVTVAALARLGAVAVDAPAKGDAAVVLVAVLRPGLLLVAVVALVLDDEPAVLRLLKVLGEVARLTLVGLGRADAACDRGVEQVERHIVILRIVLDPDRGLRLALARPRVHLVVALSVLVLRPIHHILKGHARLGLGALSLRHAGLGVVVAASLRASLYALLLLALRDLADVRQHLLVVLRQHGVDVVIPELADEALEDDTLLGAEVSTHVVVPRGQGLDQGR
eukprot:m.193274 g.193274  ORF g.193274 m.193274 type:complete len:401 (+) comp17597_c0_seq3:127-1329(+)